MSMIFFRHKCKYPSDLYAAGVEICFIAYNPADGETAFFNIREDDEGQCDNRYDFDIEPFDERQMKIVEQRYHDWCIANPDKATVSCDKSIVLFDKEAYDSFMRTLG
jgi:hypothetical protein